MFFMGMSFTGYGVAILFLRRLTALIFLRGLYRSKPKIGDLMREEGVFEIWQERAIHKGARIFETNGLEDVTCTTVDKDK